MFNLLGLSKIKFTLFMLLAGSVIWLGITEHYERKGKMEQLNKELLQERSKLRQQLERNMRLDKQINQLQERIEEQARQINEQALKIKESIDEKANSAFDDHLNGNNRLSIPTTNTSCKSDTTTTAVKSTRNTSGTKGKERSELHPESAKFLIDLARKADHYATERNQCVRLLEEMKHQVDEYNGMIGNQYISFK